MKYELKTLAEFDQWLSGLDRTLRNRVSDRLTRVQDGNFGDCKEISKNLFELRCFFGGGLRMYFTVRDGKLILLLAGGNKATQSADILRARVISESLEED